MPPGWKPCQRTYKTAPPPRRCTQSATSTSVNSRPSCRPAASAEIDPRDVRSAREPALYEPRLSDPRSPRLRNPDQLRRGERYRPRTALHPPPPCERIRPSAAMSFAQPTGPACGRLRSAKLIKPAASRPLQWGPFSPHIRGPVSVSIDRPTEPPSHLCRRRSDVISRANRVDICERCNHTETGTLDGTAESRTQQNLANWNPQAYVGSRLAVKVTRFDA